MSFPIEAAEPRGGAVIELEEEKAPEPEEPSPKLSIEDLLPAPGAAVAPAATPRAAGIGVRTARVLRVAGRKASIALRGEPAPIEAEIAPEVDPEVIDEA